MRKVNPIALFLKKLLNSDKVTLERICVACWIGDKNNHLKYHTLMNVFERPAISNYVLTMLKNGGIITDRQIKEYDEWARENLPRKKFSARKVKKFRQTEKHIPTILEDEDVFEEQSGSNKLEIEVDGSQEDAGPEV